MRRSTWGWLALAILLGLGVAMVAAAQAMSGDAVTYGSAVECPDVSSPACYQVSPGVVSYVKVTTTTSGEEDHVDVDTRGTTVHTALLPSASQAAEIKVGAAVTVKWYVGLLVAVIIKGDSIRSTESPLTGAPGFGYVGWMVIWLAGALGVAAVAGRRLMRDQAAVLQSLAGGQTTSLAGLEGIMPGGEVGWRIQPKLREALLLPIAIGVLAFASMTPFFNPQRRSIALIGDALLLAGICIRLALTARNTRVQADRLSIMKVNSLGRVRRWSLSEVAQAEMFSVLTLYSTNACIAFVAHDGSELFVVSSFIWDLNQVTALCTTLDIPLDGEYDEVRIRWSRRKRVAFWLGTLVLGALAGAYFFPAPGGQ